MTSLPAPHTVATPAATGAAYEYGAHVISWTPAGDRPVLWLSPKTALEEGTAIRGGIPVCFPWFGPGREGGREPMHGFARLATWRLVEERPDGLVLELTDRDVQLPADWQHPFVARLTATFGATFEVTFEVVNEGPDPMELEVALHTYLAVGDVREVSVRGLDGARFVDKADGASTKTQDGDIRFEGLVDRVYESTAPVEVVDPALGRTLEITTGGASRTVVWNPGEEKAATMADIGDWDTFCCVEAANALDGYVTLAPGERHALTQRIAVR